MNRIFLALFAAALCGGFSTPLVSQEQTSGDPPRLTPEQRREQWDRMRNPSPEDRRARLEELRESRLANRDEEAPAVAETEAAAAAETAETAEDLPFLERLQFRSILSLDGVTEFRLHDPAEERNFAVSETEGRNGIEVVSFDAEQNELTLRHDGETRTLFLERGRVAELQQPQRSEEADQRRERWRQRREQYRAFQEKWEQAKADSPELQALEGQFQELVGDFRQTREALREAEDGSEAQQQLRAQEREMREEFRLLSEYSVLELRRSGAFEPAELEGMERMMGRMMFRNSGGEDRRGDWGRRGRGRPN